MEDSLNLDNISKNLKKLIEKNIIHVLEQISKDYNINKNELLTKYLKIKNKNKRVNNISKTNICMARKQDGNQCTRRKKDNCDYCGKHIKNRKYGRIDENNSDMLKKFSNNDNFIMTRKEKIGNEEYLVDNNNIVYTNNINSPVIVGKKISDNKIDFIPNYKSFI